MLDTTTKPRLVRDPDDAKPTAIATEIAAERENETPQETASTSYPLLYDLSQEDDEKPFVVDLTQDDGREPVIIDLSQEDDEKPFVVDLTHDNDKEPAFIDLTLDENEPYDAVDKREQRLSRILRRTRTRPMIKARTKYRHVQFINYLQITRNLGANVLCTRPMLMPYLKTCALRALLVNSKRRAHRLLKSEISQF